MDAQLIQVGLAGTPEKKKMGRPRKPRPAEPKEKKKMGRPPKPKAPKEIIVGDAGGEKADYYSDTYVPIVFKGKNYDVDLKQGKVFEKGEYVSELVGHSGMLEFADMMLRMKEVEEPYVRVTYKGKGYIVNKDTKEVYFITPHKDYQGNIMAYLAGTVGNRTFPDLKIPSE